MSELTEKLDPLSAYAVSVMNGGLKELCPPANSITMVNRATDDEFAGIGVVLDRRGIFQTELFIVPLKTREIKVHVHPDVDSLELHVSGDFSFICSGVIDRNASNGEPLKNRVFTTVPSDAPHGGIFTQGGSFLSFQMWKNGVQPSSVGENLLETGY